MRAVGELVEGFSNLNSVLPTLTKLGKSHATRGVRPDHFDVMRDCLLESLAEVRLRLGPRFLEGPLNSRGVIYLYIARYRPITLTRCGTASWYIARRGIIQQWLANGPLQSECMNITKISDVVTSYAVRCVVGYGL